MIEIKASVNRHWIRYKGHNRIYVSPGWKFQQKFLSLIQYRGGAHSFSKPFWNVEQLLHYDGNIAYVSSTILIYETIRKWGRQWIEKKSTHKLELIYSFVWWFFWRRFVPIYIHIVACTNNQFAINCMFWISFST